MPVGRFPRSARLLTPKQFDAVFTQGRRVQDKLLGAVYLSNGATQARLGLTVSKKTAARACDRNRIKRQVRESFRQQQHQLIGVDIVISARTGSAQATASDLRATLNRLWTRITQACIVS